MQHLWRDIVVRAVEQAWARTCNMILRGDLEGEEDIRVAFSFLEESYRISLRLVGPEFGNRACMILFDVLFRGNGICMAGSDGVSMIAAASMNLRHLVPITHVSGRDLK